MKFMPGQKRYMRMCRFLFPPTVKVMPQGGWRNIWGSRSRILFLSEIFRTEKNGAG